MVAGKTLYDVLEVSASASAEAIRAAYERLVTKYDPERSENAGNPGVRLQQDAVREAFLTLGNPEKRRQYDHGMVRARAALQTAEAVPSFWTLPRVIVAGVLLAVAVFSWNGYRAEQARLARVEAERQLAEAKAKEAQEAREKARAELEQSRLEARQKRQDELTEERSRRERDAALQRYSAEQRSQAVQYQRDADRDRMQKEAAERRAESQRRMEETRAQQVAQQQAARERAELCRIERERYGKAISC